MPEIDIEAQVKQLNRSEKEQLAMADLLALLENGAVSLDVMNQQAVILLLMAAFDGKAGSVLNELRAACATV